MVTLFAGAIFFYLLPSIKQTLLDYKKETIFELTGSVIATLSHLNDRENQGELTRVQAQSMARDLIRSLRYGEEAKSYFWVSDFAHRMVVHPYRPDLEGKDLSDFKDKNGKYVFVEFVKTAENHGGGFVDYYWQWNDKPTQIEKKLSYIREFRPWGWVVGTGVYEELVKEQITGYRNTVAGIFLIILLFLILLQAYLMREAALAEAQREKFSAQREKLINALKAGEERYRTIADFGYNWEIWIGTDGTLNYCSPSCGHMVGFPPEYFMERPDRIRGMIVSDDREIWDDFLIEADKEEGDSLDIRIQTEDGRILWLNCVARAVFGIGRKPLGLRCSFRDITDRKRMENQLRHQALHDPLTGLANRTLCLDRIGQAMSRSRRSDSRYFAVVFLDLDRFKLVNDSLGHHYGDMVLTETAHRLNEHVRDLDTVSRFGGDEFVLLLDELATPSEAIRIIKRIRKELARPYKLNKTEVRTTASMGIVLSPVGDIKAEDVLQHANIAMHRAKEAGRNRFKVFTSRMLESAVTQLTLENDMRRSLDAGEFHVEYQPIMDLDGSDLMGFEALARWDHPLRGTIPPSQFIPMAEESGLILQLGEWVLRESLLELAEWRKKTSGADGLFMSVNLSSKQFARMELDKVVMDALGKAGLPPEVLKLEITESTILEYPEAAIRTLKVLRKKGVRFSIDDFGTGYSSLSQLRQLPVDTLKVDRSFISRMKTDPENMEIVKAVIALAHSLELDVVAEGVESPEQLCSLLDLECECVQGFYFHKPLKVHDVFQLLECRATAGQTSPKQTMAQIKEDCFSMKK